MLNWLLPILLFFHNAEEYYYFNNFPRQYMKLFSTRLHNKNIFFYALFIIQLAVTLILIISYTTTNLFYNHLVIVINCAIIINIVQHAMGSLIFRCMMPGTWSALILLLPYEVAYITSVQTNILIYLCIALVVTPLCIYISLCIGHFIDKIVKR